MIFFFGIATLPITPQKNGAGVTRGVVAVPFTDAPFLWRASIATLRADGSLSPFPGVGRMITLLARQPLRLYDENIGHLLAFWQPQAFPGEWTLSSVGIVESGLGFSIMT